MTQLADYAGKYKFIAMRREHGVLVEPIKRQLQEFLGYGLYNECLALMDRPEPK